jgi:F-type H+-transporting ATPase subunit c
LIFALILFFNMPTNFYGALGEIGIACALALPGFIIGIAASMPAQEALLSIARQPFLSKKITNLMLLTQSLLQTPLIFGFIIALIISNQASRITTLQEALRLIASGLCIAIATIGPAIGGGIFTGSACRSVGVNRSAYSKIFSFTILSQAIIETPVIFAAIISFWLAFGITTTTSSLFQGLIYLAIAGVMGIGTIGAGISSGRTAAAACYQIALAPEHSTAVSRTSLIAQGLIDTSAIYAFIIALFLLLARF